MVFINCLSLLPGNKDDYLRKAAEKGDIAAVKKWIDAGVPADPLRAHHTSALQLAAKGGHLDCVKVLVDAGADVNRVADCSPLLDAAAHGHTEVAKFLLYSKADVSKTWNGNTIIHLAARSGHQAIIDMLAPELDMVALVCDKNGEGKTPLMLACSQPQNSTSCIGSFLSAGADPAAEDLAGNTALHHAAIAGNHAAAQLLLAHGPRGTQALNMVNSKGRTPLHLAAAFGHQSVIEVLAKQDTANVNIKDKEGSTVLHMVCKSLMCAMSGQLGMAKAVLDRGADPEALDNAGNTPAQYSPYASVKTLLQSSAEGGAKLQHSSAQAVSPAPQAVTAPKLSTSSSGAPSQMAPNKAEKLVGALTSAMAALGPEGAAADDSNWVMKQALRRNTSDEADGWKLTTAADSGATLDDSPAVSMAGAH